MPHIKERKMEKMMQLNYDADYYYDIGIEYADSGRAEQAIYYFYRSLSLEPYNPWTIAELGLCYYDLKMYDEAISWFNRALCHDKDCTSAAIGCFMCYICMGNYTAAETFVPLCDTEELNAYVDSEEFAEVTEQIRQRNEIKEKENEFVFMGKYREKKAFERAVEYAKIGNIEGATEALVEVDPKSGGYPEAAFMRAVFACAEKKYDRLSAIAKEMGDHCPDDEFTAIVKAMATHVEGDEKAEVEAMKKLKIIKIADVSIFMRAISCFEDLGMLEAADMFVDRALKIEPMNKKLRIMSALCSHNLKRHDECRRKFCDLNRLFPEDGGISCLADMTLRMPDLHMPITVDLRAGVSDYYVPKFLEELASLGDWDAVEKKYDEDDGFYDRMMAFFTSGRGEFIEKIVPAVSLNKRLSPILRELMVMPSVPVTLKIQCMASLLKNERKREFAVQSDDITALEFVKVKMPRMNESLDVYRIARSALAFASLSQFEYKLLNKFIGVREHIGKVLDRDGYESVNAAWLLLAVFGKDAMFFLDMLGVSERQLMELEPEWKGEMNENEEDKQTEEVNAQDENN